MIKKTNETVLNHYKKRINASSQNCVCFNNVEEDSSKNEMKSFEDVNKQLSMEIRSYDYWVQDFQNTSRPLFAKIFNMFRNKIEKYFGSDVDVLPAGSFSTGLFVKSSDLNIHANFRRKSHTESELNNSVYSFSNMLSIDKSLIESAHVESKPNMIILKIKLVKGFHSKEVEIVFKIVLPYSLTRNEDIIRQYLAHYPIIKPLYLLFRGLISHAKLDDPSTGGINTFAIFLLVVAFIQKIEMLPNYINTFEKTNYELNASNENFPSTEQSYKSQKTISTVTKDRPENSFNHSHCVTVNNEHLGPVFNNLLYFYAYSFDYLRAYISPHQPNITQGESIFPVI